MRSSAGISFGSEFPFVACESSSMHAAGRMRLKWGHGGSPFRCGSLCFVPFAFGRDYRQARSTGRARVAPSQALTPFAVAVRCWWCVEHGPQGRSPRGVGVTVHNQAVLWF
jgi:hypothetical protein